MLPLVQRSINTQLHEVLGVEPARIAFGGFQTLDRFLLPDTIPGAVQQGIAAIPAKGSVARGRRVFEALGSTHNLKLSLSSVHRNAEEYHHKYLKSRVRKVATSSTEPYKAGDWVLAQWQGLPQWRTRPTKLSPCWRGPFSIVAVDEFDSTGYPSGSD